MRERLSIVIAFTTEGGPEVATCGFKIKENGGGVRSLGLAIDFL